MPQQQQQQDESILVGVMVKALITGCCLTVEAFLHHGFGRRYVSEGIAGVVVIYGFIAFFPQYNSMPLYGFIAAYAAAWLTAMVLMGIRNWRKRDSLHSGYTGQPHIQRFLPTLREVTIKHLEEMAVFGIGFWTRYFNVPLGDYLMLAASVMFARDVLVTSKLRRQAEELNDLVIEQGHVADRFRDMQLQ